MKFIYKKWYEESYTDSIEFNDELHNLMEKTFSNSNPASQLENMLKYGFNLKDKPVMGINDFIRQIRRKKLEEMKKNLTGSYEEQVSQVKQVKDTEQKEVNSQLSEKFSKLEGQNLKRTEKEKLSELIKDLQERKQMLSEIPESFRQGLERLKKYDETKNFLSKEAKRIFDELIKNFDKIQKLEDFLKKHPYGFKEGPPLSLDESVETADRFNKLEEIEEKLKDGEIGDIPPELIKELLSEQDYRDFLKLHRLYEMVKKSGFFVVKGNSIMLTPQGVRKIGYKVLKDIFSDIKRAVSGFHQTKRSGNYELDYEDKKKWEFGSNINIDILSTIGNAIIDGRFDRNSGKIFLSPDDFVIYNRKFSSMASSAILIDTSWSMSWGNKFECAKKVALALHSLISSYFPNDTFYIIAFFTVAVEIKPHELPSVELNMNDPFTNMQDAIRLARKLLRKSPSDEKYVMIVTDGQPTAYCIGNRVFVEWPVMGCSPNAMRETLKEVEGATKENIKINVFMVDDNPQVEKFVEEMVRINKGKAFFTTPESLGKYVLLDFLSRKRAVIK